MGRGRNRQENAEETVFNAHQALIQFRLLAFVYNVGGAIMVFLATGLIGRTKADDDIIYNFW